MCYAILCNSHNQLYYSRKYPYIYEIGLMGIMLLNEQLIQAHIRQICLMFKGGMFALVVLFIKVCRVCSDTEIKAYVCCIKPRLLFKGLLVQASQIDFFTKARMKKAFLYLAFLFLILFLSSSLRVLQRNPYKRLPLNEGFLISKHGTF